MTDLNAATLTITDLRARLAAAERTIEEQSAHLDDVTRERDAALGRPASWPKGYGEAEAIHLDFMTDFGAVVRQRDAARKEIAALRGALAGLINHPTVGEPRYWLSGNIRDMQVFCYYCRGGLTHPWDKHFDHAQNCPTFIARALLADPPTEVTS